MKQLPPRGFGAPIAFSKRHNGYHYHETDFSIDHLQLKDEEWKALGFAAQLLHQYHKVPLFADFRSAMERIHARFAISGLSNLQERPMMQFESPVETHGMEWLQPIFRAMNNDEGIRFSYRNIYRQQTKSHVLIPQLLREHRNRWYVIGWNEEKNDHLTFALDRILSLETFHHLRKVPVIEMENFYLFSAGIMRNNSKAVDIVLLIQHPLSELVLLEPLHVSQTIVKHTEENIRIALKLQLNEELYLRILGLGPWCKVIQPKSLQNTICNMATKMTEQYPSVKS